jgi:hypothetical protein
VIRLGVGEEELIRDEDLAGLGTLRAEMVRFGVRALPALRAMDFAARKALLDAASELSLREPLQFHFKRNLRLPGWSNPASMTGEEIIAMMAFGLFVHMNSDERACSALVEMFPEISAAVRADARRVTVAARARLEAERRRVEAEAPLFAALVD